MSSAETLSHLLDAAPSAFYIFDIRQRQNVLLNRDIAITLGYSSHDATEVEFVRSVMHPDDWPAFLDYMERLSGVSNEETAEFEYRMRHRDGTWRWFHR